MLILGGLACVGDGCSRRTPLRLWLPSDSMDNEKPIGQKTTARRSRNHKAAFPVGVYRLSVGLQPELGIAQRYAEVREGKGLKFVGNVADTIFKVDP